MGIAGLVSFFGYLFLTISKNRQEELEKRMQELYYENFHEEKERLLDCLLDGKDLIREALEEAKNISTSDISALKEEILDLEDRIRSMEEKTKTLWQRVKESWSKYN